MLVVASWNVLADAYAKPQFYPHTRPRILEDRAGRRARIVARLATTLADVIALQEIDPQLFEAVRHGFEARFLAKRGKPDGVALLIRGRSAVSFRELVFSDGTGHGALAAVVGGIGVVTTHLRWQAPETPPAEHLGRRELAEVLSWVRPGEPWIVCGDLNAEVGSEVLALAAAHGLRDAYALLPHAYTCNPNGRAKRIDYLLHTADLRAEPRPLPAIDDVTPLPSDSEASDHLLIAASFS